ncbi:unnamed protein product [Ostreobium quekettii]|uniref:rRNA methyltransferase 2, mitochondrial n=1 Tax=Ostreobium quekettii TaxID=121088 RepID=A0A8S1INY1_9CHLO|nr:unnamed protein product [Ostreobium quekettii]|eukprot:evm.model.scf_209.13 EVM.evm.TU.scf_209.13   scf_209:79829-83193(-)
MSWSNKVLHDKFFKQAKKAGYVSRAAFKLKEIQDKHKIISPGGFVLDLGCAPGAWLQVACQELGPRKRGGLVLGVDIQDVKIPQKFCDDRVRVLQGDARDLTPQMLREHGPQGFDAVLSDMLPPTTGHAEIDVERSAELASVALHIAVGYLFDKFEEERPPTDESGVLKAKGSLVMKIFEGSGTGEIVADARKYFEKISRVRPQATRKTSREFYLVCKSRKPAG